MTHLYIDDERIPSTDHPWIVVRSYDEAIAYLSSTPCPDYISFDHDLGDGPTGKDIATWMVRRDLNCEPGTNYIPDNFKFNVHSANPVGRDNIKAVLEGYLAFRENEMFMDSKPKLCSGTLWWALNKMRTFTGIKR